MFQLIESIKRCKSDPKFSDRFFELFLNSDERIRKAFENADLANERFIFNRLLHRMLLQSCGVQGVAGGIDRSDDVRPWEPGFQRDYYHCWLDCLIRAAREMDSEFSPKLEQQWRDTFGREFECILSTRP
ncbi:MAG: hypothetical protein ACE5FN_10000 [Leptospirillia bacterium]